MSLLINPADLGTCPKCNDLNNSQAADGSFFCRRCTPDARPLMRDMNRFPNPTKSVRNMQSDSDTIQADSGATDALAAEANVRTMAIAALIAEYTHLELSEYRHGRKDGARVAEMIVSDLKRLIGQEESGKTTS
jgi:hypothetical protein